MMVTLINHYTMENENLYQLQQRYLQYCSIIRNYKKTTLGSYKSTFNLFLQETELKHPSELNKAVVENWFYNGRLKRNWSSSTFRSYLKHLNTFFKWLLKENIIPKNYLDEIEKPRMETHLPRTLSLEEAEKILEASQHLAYTYKFERFRNHALIAIMLLAGLRRGEVINLKFNDISISNKTIFIDQGKGSKDRMIPINNRLERVLTEYLQERNRTKKNCIHFFAGAQKEEQIGTRCIKLLIARLRKATKIDFSAHTLRHAFARLMLEGGCDIYTLSKIMGHSKITTTTIYLSCSNQQMSKSIEMHSLN